MTLVPLPADYGPWLADLKRRIQGARTRAVLATNAEQIRLYHDLGREILARQEAQGWGAKVIDRLAEDLSAAFPDMKGLSSRNLKYVKHFAQKCPDLAIGQQPAAQLPWFHIVTLITTHREGQRPDPSLAQGNALGSQPGMKPSPEGATQPLPNEWAAPSGLTPSFTVSPGRCPGLSWAGPLALSHASSQGQRPDLSPAQGNALGTERPAPTPAQGNALGTRLRYVRALKGRPNPCHNLSPASKSIWFLAPSTANPGSPMTCVPRCMHIWPPSCRTWTAQPCSSTPSRTTFTSCSNWPVPGPSARWLNQSRSVHRNGSRPRAATMRVFPGRPDMGRSRSANRRSPSFEPTSPDRKNITCEARFRMNTVAFWNDIGWDSTSAMSGIRSPLQGSARGDSMTQGVALGCHGSGLWPFRLPGTDQGQPVMSKMETTYPSAPPRLRVTPLKSPR